MLCAFCVCVFFGLVCACVCYNTFACVRWRVMSCVTLYGLCVVFVCSSVCALSYEVFVCFVCVTV